LKKEGQGYPNFDHCAWYRIGGRIPEAWQQREVYLSFEGGDDCYDLFINGELVGKGGDPVTKVSTFAERKSWKITSSVKHGEEAILAVRVYDWYGAGGIFRPVTLGRVVRNCPSSGWFMPMPKPLMVAVRLGQL